MKTLTPSKRQRVEQENALDEVLVVAAILGDLDAFNVLVQRYAPAVVRVARSIVGNQHAEDVAQEAWLLAFKALPSIDAPNKFASWIMVITRNRALRVREQEFKKASRYVPMDAFLIEQLSALQQPAIHEEEEDRVRSALDALPEEYSLVLRMRYYDAFPLQRIAAFLDVPLSTIKWRIYRGKQLLKEHVKKDQ